MNCLVSCKNEEDQIKKEGTKVFTTLYIDFFRCSRAVNSVVIGRIWLKFELIQAFMHVLVFCRNEEDQIKNEGTRVFTSLLPLKVYRDFFSDAQRQLTPLSKVGSGRISNSSETS